MLFLLGACSVVVVSVRICGKNVYCIQTVSYNVCTATVDCVTY